MKKYLSFTLFCLFALAPTTASAQGSLKDLGVSEAVTQETLSTLVRLHNRNRAGNATAGDFQAAGIALRILFAHWEETGFNARIQAQIRGQASLLQNPYAPTDEQVRNLYTHLSMAGAAISLDDVRRVLNVPLDARQKFLQEYDRPGGIQRLQGEIVRTFFQLAARAQNKGGTFARLTTIENHGVWLTPVELTQADVCFYSGATALYTGVISLSCPLCAPVTGWVSVISGSIALLTC